MKNTQEESQTGATQMYDVISKYMDDAIFMISTPIDIIVDPSAGFLVSSVEYLETNNQDLFNVQELKKHYNETMFHGFGMDRIMLRIGA